MTAKSLAGTWVSEAQRTRLEPTRFRFRFQDDGWFSITGFSVTTPEQQVYHRNGRYTLRGNRFYSSAINDGRPVYLEKHGARLSFVIDDELSYDLSRVVR